MKTIFFAIGSIALYVMLLGAAIVKEQFNAAVFCGAMAAWGILSIVFDWKESQED